MLLTFVSTFITTRSKSSCSLSSVREHYLKRAGKARVSEARLSIRLCVFPKALFMKTVSHAMHGWRFGEYAGGKGYKKSG